LAVEFEALAARGDPWARSLRRVDSAAGQTWLRTVAAVLAKPPSQDIVTSTFDCLRGYFAPLRSEGDPNMPLEALIAEAETLAVDLGRAGTLGDLLVQYPDLKADIAAVWVLSGLGYGVIRPVLPDPTALGTLMRRKLAPVLDPVLGFLQVLRGGRR
jgi:hypothetical protein